MPNLARLIAAPFFVIALAACGAKEPLALYPNRDRLERFDSIHDMRARFHRPAAQNSKALNELAQKHGRDMIRNHFYGHTGSDGSDLALRLKRAGYSYCWAGENIAKGPKSLDTVVREWLTSQGHKDILLNKNATEFGIAKVTRRHWVLVMAEPGCAEVPKPRTAGPTATGSKQDQALPNAAAL